MSLIAKTAELLREEDVVLYKVSEKHNYIFVATYWNPPPPPPPSANGQYYEYSIVSFPKNMVDIVYSEGVLSFGYMIGQVGCVLKSSNEPEVIVKAVVDFYKMGEREHEKLYPIGKAFFKLQFEGLAAHIVDDKTIAVGIYEDGIHEVSYPQMTEAAASKTYTITDYIHKEIETWSVVAASSDDKTTFKMIEAAAQHILTQRKGEKRREGW